MSIITLLLMTSMKDAPRKAWPLQCMCVKEIDIGSVMCKLHVRYQTLWLLVKIIIYNVTMTMVVKDTI